MIVNYVTIGAIVEQLNRDYIPGVYWNIEELKEWTSEALGKISKDPGDTPAYSNIEIKDGKAKIPADVELLDTVNRIDSGNNYEMYPLLPNHDLDDTTYIIENGFIHVTFPKGLLRLKYYSTPVDSEGNPMVPDTIYYRSAVVAYLQYKIARRAFFAGKILQNQLTMLEQEWYFYNNAAGNEQKMHKIKNDRKFRRLSNKFRL